jgi:hypothetical protein
MQLVRFYAAIFKLALVLAMLGVLKTCTLEVMGLAAAKSQVGIMSYSKYSRMLASGK